MIFNTINSHLDTVFSFLTLNIYLYNIYPTGYFNWWEVQREGRDDGEWISLYENYYNMQLFWHALLSFTDSGLHSTRVFSRKPLPDDESSKQHWKLDSMSYAPFNHIVGPWILTRHVKFVSNVYQTTLKRIELQTLLLASIFNLEFRISPVSFLLLALQWRISWTFGTS